MCRALQCILCELYCMCSVLCVVYCSQCCDHWLCCNLLCRKWHLHLTCVTLYCIMYCNFIVFYRTVPYSILFYYNIIYCIADCILTLVSFSRQNGTWPIFWHLISYLCVMVSVMSSFSCSTAPFVFQLPPLLSVDWRPPSSSSFWGGSW